MRFELEVELQAKSYKYTLALDFPQGFKELRVFEESLVADGVQIYSRELAQVKLARMGRDFEASFRIDWHLIALPIVQEQSNRDPLFIFKRWLASMLILRPMPSLIRGDSEQDTLEPNAQMTDLGAWFAGIISLAPSAYSRIEEYLREVMPDIEDIKNPVIAKDSRSLLIQFSTQQGSVEFPFEDLSDGEKCFMIFALVVAANGAYGPLLCFWDEPDNFLAPSEVGSSVMALRRAYSKRGQLIVTSHNPEAIRRFSDENTVVLHRRSHLEPTVATPLDRARGAGDFKGDLIDALIRGDVGNGS